MADRYPPAELDEPSPFLRLGEDIVVEHCTVRARDGVSLAVDVYRPAQGGPWPALYAVAPYRKNLVYLPPWPAFRTRETGDIAWWVRRGYAYVLADTRGSGESREGVWRLFDTAEQHDLYDTIEWIAQQDWCTGRVGMIGESYYAMVQWLAAAQNPPHLACIAPFDACADLYRDFVYHGGIFSMEFLGHWSSKVRARTLLDAPGPHPENVMAWDMIGAFLRHPLYDAFWEERSAAAKLHQVRVPTYSIGNWQMVGLHLRGNLLGYELVRGPKKLTIYSGSGLRGPQALFASKELHLELLRWYDYWLKGIDTGIMDEPPVRYMVRPSGAWRTLPDWPPRDVEYTPLYLAPGKAGAVESLNDGCLSWEAPPAGAPPTSYTYPHPEWGGWPGPGTAVLRPDGTLDGVAKIVTFTTPPLEQDVEILGPIVLRLWAASDQTDTDFYVKLADQAPPGEQGSPPGGITRGWLRASHRALDPARSTPYRPFHSHTERQPLVPGQVYEFAIEVWPTSWVFKRGHRIRLEIAPGDSPVLDAPFGHDYGVKMGTDTIYHDRARPSHLLLPIRR
ncbi:MAG TPA: CocE/NonD family hydrolase [Chloroflexota bacterium]|nr:CocE/NonD family hydrolase [Chloroflexota bacterium]